MLTLTTTHVALAIAAMVIGAVVAIWGAGKAYGLLIAEVRTGNTIAAEGERKIDGLGKSIDRYKGEARREFRELRDTDAELGTRVALVEQLAGLPPPWKRTQPIRPVPPEQDMFPEGQGDSE